MLTEERKQVILERLGREGRVIAGALADEFGVSEDTVRRDLRELAAEGLLKRVHGGALPASRAAALPVAEREQEPAGEKSALAAFAAGLVRPGQTILVDGGSTNLLLARRLPRDLTGTVVTTSPAVALALADHAAVEVILTGGRLIGRTGTLAGPDAVQAVRAVRADLCFLGVCSLDPEVGITCAERDEIFVKRAMIEAAGEVIALGTAEKLGAVAAHVVAPVTELSRLVVPGEVPERRTAPFTARGVEVVRAPAAEP